MVLVETVRGRSITEWSRYADIVKSLLQDRPTRACTTANRNRGMAEAAGAGPVRRLLLATAVQRRHSRGRKLDRGSPMMPP